MTTPLTPRRRGRGRGDGAVPSAGGAAGGPEVDALGPLRRALTGLDPAGFAACFAPDGWLRVPRPEGDVVLRGAAQIEQAGRELREIVTDLTWTPSQRFLAAGEVVEQAVAHARLVPAPGSGGTAPVPTAARAGTAGATGAGRTDDEAPTVRVPVRVVAAVAPGGAVAGLTLWVDWAALRDPTGTSSASGAASALVAQARAREERGLQVFRSEPSGETGALPLPPAPRAPTDRPLRPAPPPARVLWWRRHRTTLAGTAMALAAAGVIASVGVTVLRATGDARPAASGTGVGTPSPIGSATSAGAASGGSPTTSPTTAPTSAPATGALPPVRSAEPSAKPTVQAGKSYDIKSDLLFGTGSSRLSPDALGIIATVARNVRQAEVTGEIQVNGYTDDTGSTALNARLSRRRAQAVARALAEQLRGEPVQLVPQGFGEDAPVASNDTAGGRARNRHVTVVLPTPRD